MITIKKILGSIITSFLFSLLLIFVSIHFVVTLIRVNNINASNIVDTSDIYSYLVKEDNEDIKNEMIDYLEEYKNYIFYKRSYPTISYNEMTKDEKKVYNRLKDKVDLNYETVINVRGLYNFMQNNSVYFLTNMGLLVIVIMCSIRYLDFNKGFHLLGISTIVSSIIILIGSVYFVRVSTNDLINITIQKSNITSKLFKLDVIYIMIGLLLFIVTFLINKKKDNFSLQF